MRLRSCRREKLLESQKSLRDIEGRAWSASKFVMFAYQRIIGILRTQAYKGDCLIGFLCDTFLERLGA
jgi:hypothetical protein